MQERVLPGLRRDGKIQLPNQWSLKPTGRQVVLGDFPVNLVVHPKEPFAAVLHSGFGEHEALIIDLQRDKVVSRVTMPETLWGLAFDPAGNALYCSGGTSEVIYAYDFARGYLSNQRKIALGNAQREQLVPCGLCVAADGGTLYVAQTWGQSVAAVSLAEPEKIRRIPLPAESFPYTTLLASDGRTLYVSLWAKAAVAVLDVTTGEVKQLWSTKAAGEKTGGEHPTEMLLSPDGQRLFVACANSNTVVVLKTATGEQQEVISSSLYPNLPVGSTPTSISLSSNGQVLLIANSDNNNIAMVDVSEPGKANSLGHIPVGWYPTAVRFGPDDQIYVTNGKGSQSFANPQGPQPELNGGTPTRQYIGGLMRGTLCVIPVPSPAQMAAYTKTARECSPLAADLRPVLQPREANHPIPAKVGGASPIKRCIYVIKENRTYDQVLGDLPAGNGDPQLCLFPEKVTPNHHALAREFGILDNFYVESEVSADGHEWSMAAYATDATERLWPLNYRGGGGEKIGYPSEGTYPFMGSSGGYIWDRCKQANVTYRSYGEFVENGLTPDAPGRATAPGLEGHFDPLFRSYDLDYLDNKRVDRFLAELAEFEKRGEMPRFIVLRLPNDHTYGTQPGKPTPTAMVAENDLAFGRFVEAISNSKFWKETAIFVVEDDAQNGSDHVDAHRTIAFTISPFSKRNAVDSTLYSTASMLRTMELILGLEPMSQFDAAAAPMYQSFTAEANFTPYKHLPAQVDLHELNKPDAYGAQESLKMDFSKEDAADDLLLNEVVWRSVRGAKSKMPPPVRAAFVRALHEADEDD
jgi:DNA-binding beta-propeller fold protein YncE